MVSASDDHTLRVWDRTTGAELRVVSTGTESCEAGVTMLHDGTIVGACSDLTFRRWMADGTETRAPTGIWMHYGSLSADERWFVGGHSNGQVRTLQLSTNALGPIRTLHRHHIYVVDQTRTGQILTAALDNMLRLWTPELKLVAEFEADTRDGLLAGALSPDGAIAVSGSEDGILEAWNVATREHLVRLPKAHKGTIWAVASAKGRFYTAGEDGLVKAWDSNTWALLQTLNADETKAYSLAVADEGATLVAGYGTGAIVVWDIASGKPRWRTGGRTREHGSCDDFAAQTWVDDAHRAIVVAACASDAGAYIAGYAARSHLRIAGDVDVKTSW